MNRATQARDLGGINTSLLEKELAERKARLAQAQSDVHHRFLCYADEQACVAVLEKALAKAYRFF